MPTRALIPQPPDSELPPPQKEPAAHRPKQNSTHLVAPVAPPQLLNRLVSAPRQLDGQVHAPAPVDGCLVGVEADAGRGGVADDGDELAAQHELIALFDWGWGVGGWVLGLGLGVGVLGMCGGTGRVGMGGKGVCGGSHFVSFLSRNDRTAASMPVQWTC